MRVTPDPRVFGFCPDYALLLCAPKCQRAFTGSACNFPPNGMDPEPLYRTMPRLNRLPTASAKNRQRLDQAEPRGKVKVVLKSNISMIGKDSVTLDQEGRTFELKNDAVIVCAGGVLPTPFLKQIGVMVETHYGTAIAR